MFSPEVRRIALMVALAAISYLLLLAWNEDYGIGSDPEPTEAPAPIAADDAPTVPVPADDLPDASIGAESVPAAALEPVPPAPEDTAPRQVQVTTPELRLTIDRLGGDVVALALPKYPRSTENATPFRLLAQDGQHTYVAQSGLIGPDGVDSTGERPLYTALRSDYRLGEDDDELAVELRHETAAGVEVIKRFRFEAGSYAFDVEHEVRNGSVADVRARLFAQLKRDDSTPEEEGFQIGPRPYVGAALTTPEDRYNKVDFDDVDESEFRADVTGGWVAMLQHYFVVAWVANPEELNAYTGRRLAGLGRPLYAFGYVAPEFRVAPGATQVVAAKLYAGPKHQDRLEAIAENLSLTVDYGILWWLAVPLFQALAYIQSWVINWGVAILLLTLAIKLVLYPLSAIAYRSGAKMRRVAPQLKRLQERHADDRRKLSAEMMELYRREGANPFGGCLPMLLQMPVFFALYWVLYESVELRQAPFFLWIEDLSVMDPFFVLPILMGGSMYLMQMLNPPMPDPMQARMMKMMPFLFTAFSLFFPSGLVLYWLANNLLSLLQQWYVTRQADREAAA